MEGERKVVELFYDVVSPYSYLALELMARCGRKWKKIDLKLRPAWLKEVMIATGNRPPASVPTKARYLGKDLMQLSTYSNIPFALPKDIPTVMHVKGSEKAQRLLTVIAREHPEHLEEVSRQLYHRIWHRDEDIVEESSLREACAAANVPEEIITKLLKQAAQENTLHDLKKASAEAVENGAFGFPTIVLHNSGKRDIFFGADRIFLLAHYLGEEWPLLND